MGWVEWKPTGPIPPFVFPVYHATEAEKKKALAESMETAVGLYDTWIHYATKKPPKDLFGKIIYFFGLIGQMVLSLLTFPAGMAAFLIEEATQAMGMGAYMLVQGRLWEELEDYLEKFKDTITAGKTTVEGLAVINPITGATVLNYLSMAEYQYNAMKALVEKKLQEKAEKDEETRKKLMEAQKYGSLQLLSQPTNAEIWIDGENTEKLTPETFKNLEVGEHVIELRKYSVKRETWDIFSFTIGIEAGIKKEVMVRIPPTITSDEESGEEPEEKSTPQLPDFIFAEVEGDYAIDGDTFVTVTGEKIRVYGIDAPEIGRPYAEEAKEMLQSLIEDKKIRIKIQSDKPLDGYGRTLAECRSYKGNIGVLILAAGLAKTDIFPDDKFDPTRYIAAEKSAQERRVGIWSEME